ncbi:MAG: PIF1 family DEAD/DEAH box helicase [Candidatus Moranbacteria bacterium]|nr:PIF1 family DEAD/DEAH box helicase [Candidatus Moranbacteria bacterium]MDD3965295.1 PIF1 family DEAD/DEAH box helicase [Candidatus Moranbacteria bacterium]
MTQSEALALLKTGANVFLTGEAGSGKTYTINQYTDYLRSHEIDFAVTASTGIAATHIHGMTIHSWSGIGVHQEADEDELKHIAENRYVAKRIKRAKVLIIDEVSMLDGKVLTLVERVCRKARKLRLPFGGLQVVLVGDFFQLPPIAKKETAIEFAFDSDAWQGSMPIVCYLTEQHRQEDSKFLDILSAIRNNTFDEMHFESLSERIISHEELPDDMTRLFSHNTNVDTINTKELQKLPGKTKLFVMAARGPETLTDALIRGCLSPERLELKEGAAVMFTKNNANQGFVNGTLGTVIGFDTTTHYPIVRTSSGTHIETEPMEWTIAEGDEIFAKITQIPLRLAWAMTIHKSQGVSLDAAVIDLSQTFEYGQGYVALSRVRTLSGIHLLGVNARAFQVHPLVSEKDEQFRRTSETAREEYRQFSKERVEEMEKNFIVLCEGKHQIKKQKSVKKKKTVSVGKSLEEIREKHPKAYAKWTTEEDEKLRKLWNKGTQVLALTEVFGRKKGAITSRLKKLLLLH